MARLPGVLTFFLLLPGAALAHTKWVVPAEAERLPQFYQSEPTAALLLGLAAACVAWAGWLLQRRYQGHPLLRRWRDRLIPYFRYHPLVLRLLLGTGLLLLAASGEAFAPELKLPYSHPVIWLEALAGLAFLTGFGIPWAAMLVGLLWLGGVADVGLRELADYFLFTVAGWYLAVLTPGAPRHFSQWEKRSAFRLLRFAVGLTIFWLGLEKWTEPGLTTAIMEAYHLPTPGISPLLFAGVAGAVEMLLGMLIVLDVGTRPVALLLGLAFLATVPIFGPAEVIGHLIFYGHIFGFVTAPDTESGWPPEATAGGPPHAQ
jgi:uncharacterized membrane protein YphA (DoxX/SURF4 family)